MNLEFERKLLYKEISLLAHAFVGDEEGYALFTEEDLKSLESEDIESLRRVRGRLRDLCRSLGGAKGGRG